jgi:arylsulfatase A-like enzyme
MLSGLAPSEHGIWGPNVLDDEGWPLPGAVHGRVLDRWLPAELAAAGYRTLGISANAWIGHYLGFAQGFNRFLTIKDNPSGRTGRTRAARLGHLLPDMMANRLRRRRVTTHLRRRGQDWGANRSLAALGAWLAESGQPFFAFMNFMEPHWPYYPPGDFDGFSAAEARRALDVLVRYRSPFALAVTDGLAGRERLPSEDLDMLRRLYMGEVGYLDRCLGQLLDRMADGGRLEDDRRRPRRAHRRAWPPRPRGFGVRTPLARPAARARPGGAGRPRRPAHPGPVPGLPRLGTGRGGHPDDRWTRPCRTRGLWHHAGAVRRARGVTDSARLKATVWAVYDQDWKYVCDQTGAEALYDLATDPGETTDVAASGPLEAMRLRLAECLASHRPFLLGPKSESGKRDLDLENELRALGYL